MNIPLGFEIDTGKRVDIPLNHMVVLGQTQLSGKTTTLEALVARAGIRAVAFITKPGEKSFRLAHNIPAYFSEATLEEFWHHVVAILEYRSEAHLGWRERGMVMKLCTEYEGVGYRDVEQQPAKEGKKAKNSAGHMKRARVRYGWKAASTLEGVLENIELYFPFANRGDEMILLQLREYLEPAIAEIRKTSFSEKLELTRGINVMDITDLSDGLKSLVIRSVIEHIHKRMRKTVVIVPEAWKFIPEGRSTPVKLALEGLIREGAGIENFVWMDSQDLRGVDKKLLRSVIVWLFGVQRQRNEVAMTLDSIPDHPKPSATEIMQLGKGQFFVSYGTVCFATYVQPAGMEDEHAKAIALGDEDPSSWKGIEAELRKRRDVENPEEEALRDAPGSSAKHPVPQDDREDEVYREQYLQLRAKIVAALDLPVSETVASDQELVTEVHLLKKAHGILSGRLEELEKASRAPVSPDAGKPAEGHVTPSAGNGNYPNPFDAAADLESVWRFVLERAASVDGAAQLLRVLSARPELEIKIERKTVSTDPSKLWGAVALLISEAFFDNPRKSADVRGELVRRGFMGVKTPDIRVFGALEELVKRGFLTKESTGYQAVPGMKIHIREAGR